jgi:hypothetical protein
VQAKIRGSGEACLIFDELDYRLRFVDLTASSSPAETKAMRIDMVLRGWLSLSLSGRKTRHGGVVLQARFGS